MYDAATEPERFGKAKRDDELKVRRPAFGWVQKDHEELALYICYGIESRAFRCRNCGTVKFSNPSYMA